MNVTLNTSISHNQYNAGKQPSFRGAAVPRKSAFLKPFEKGYDKLVEGLTKYYEAPMYSNRLANWFSHRDDIGRIVDHMQVIGSFVVTGMYMTQTIRNQNMDEKRKKTLAINQGLTLLASTAIAHFISEKLVEPWNKHVSMKYAANKLECTKEELAEKLKEHQLKIKKQYIKKHPEDIKLENVNLKSQRKIYETAIEKGKELPEFDKYLQDLLDKKSLDLELNTFKKPNLIHYAEEGLKNTFLKNKLKGLDVLKSLIIFGSVYRFFGPVAVTPVANWIGNKLFYHSDKKEINPKEISNSQSVQNQKAQDFQINQVKFEKFIDNLNQA